MLNNIIKLALVVVLLIPAGLGAQESDVAGIKISGFFDVVTAFNQPSHEVNRFLLGQAELDLAKEISPQMNALLTVVYNNTAAAYGIGVATIDIHPLNLSEKSHSVIGKINGAGIIAGKFDVPFGLDWRQCASICRKLTTLPTVVASTHGGWNDMGLQAYLNCDRVNVSAFAVNGFASMAETTSWVLNLETLELEEQIETINTTPSNAFGARVGMTPLPAVELGASFAEGLNKSDKVEMFIWGLDGRVALADLQLQGEYIHYNKNRSVTNDKLQGYYLQAEYAFNWLGLSARFDRIQLASDGPWSEYLSLGNYFQFYKAAQVRFEYRINNRSDRDIFYGQLVVGF